MTRYQVYLRLAGHEWTFTEPVDDEPLADGLTVLAGLSFAWSMPGPLWPLQPDPMTADFVLNVPDFVEASLARSAEVDTVAIEVKADYAGDVIASFYGDVTDYKATTRDGRPGVFVSVVAVDPTVRLRERAPTWVLVDDFTDTDMLELLTRMWADASTGLGQTGATVPALPALVLPAVLDDSSLKYGEPQSVAELLDQLLIQSFDSFNGRLILSPNVMPDGYFDPDTAAWSTAGGAFYNLDAITTRSGGLLRIHELDASEVRRDDIAWSNVKGRTIGQVIATGYGGDSNAYTASTVPGASSTTVEAVAVTFRDASDAQRISDGYAATGRFDPWQVDKLTIPVSRAAVDVPVGLFPDWKALPDDWEGRAGCYWSGLRVNGVDTTRTPDGQSYIEGILVGMRCTVSGRALVLEASLRRQDIGQASDFTFGPYGVQPFAGLVPTTP